MKFQRKAVGAEALANTKANLAIMENPLVKVPSCDFCAAPDPLWVYAASRMSTGEFRNCWRWMACKDCAEKIEAGEFEALIDKIVTVLDKHYSEVLKTYQMPKPVLREAAKYSLREFIQYAIREEA